VRTEEFAKPPGTDRSFAGFLASLPDVLVAGDFRSVVAAIASAARKQRAVVVMLGGHIVKTGVARSSSTSWSGGSLRISQ
jgi:hypothetical protein